MNQVELLVTLQAWPGKKEEEEDFLKSALPLVGAEADTTAWFSFKVGPATFGIFDTFKDEDGRTAHASREVAEPIFTRAEELFGSAPRIQTADILTEKLSSRR